MCVCVCVSADVGVRLADETADGKLKGEGLSSKSQNGRYAER